MKDHMVTLSTEQVARIVDGVVHPQRRCSIHPNESRQLAADYLEVLASSGGWPGPTRLLLKADIRLEAPNSLCWRAINQRAWGCYLARRDYFLDVNPRLKKVLRRLLTRKPQSQWVFPSPQDLFEPISATALRRYLNEALEDTGIEDEVGGAVSFLTFRNYFIATCVRDPDIDYELIARWVGHRTPETIRLAFGNWLRRAASGQKMARKLKF
jgi:integrase